MFGNRALFKGLFIIPKRLSEMCPEMFLLLNSKYTHITWFIKTYYNTIASLFTFFFSDDMREIVSDVKHYTLFVKLSFN